MPKRNALFPIAYDEISLVDAGGGESEDGSVAPSVLIMKRDGSKILKLNPVSNSPGTKPTRRKRQTSSAATIKPERVSAATTKPERVSATQGKRKKSDPCDPKSSTGKKTGKSSQRAKNWQEGKHPRQQGGKFGQTSQSSKQKYGKGGTTKAKQVAECKRRHSGGSGKTRITPLNARAANAKGLKRAARGIGASVTKSWKTDAQLRALVERKAAR